MDDPETPSIHFSSLLFTLSKIPILLGLTFQILFKLEYLDEYASYHHQIWAIACLSGIELMYRAF